MEEMLDNLKQQISSFPIPLESSVSWHIESHQKTIDAFKFFIDLVSKFYTDTQSEITLLKDKNKYLLSLHSELLGFVNSKNGEIEKLSTELTNLSNSLNKRKPVTRTFEVNDIATSSWHIIYMSKSDFTYKINKIKFNNSTNYYFSFTKQNWQNILLLYFDSLQDTWNIDYSIFITEW